jgi:hypothetical protein
MGHEQTSRSRSTWCSFTVAAVLAFALLTPRDVGATDSPIAVGEVSPPPAGSGIDAAVLRDAATEELKQIDASRIPSRRRILVSLALTKALAEKTISCTVNAMLRDAQTGAMIAIIEAGAQAEGPASAELRMQVAYAAVRSAVRRIPNALGAK